jgi:hypothetical protein
VRAQKIQTRKPVERLMLLSSLVRQRMPQCQLLLPMEQALIQTYHRLKKQAQVLE